MNADLFNEGLFDKVEFGGGEHDDIIAENAGGDVDYFWHGHFYDNLYAWSFYECLYISSFASSPDVVK